MLSLGFIEEKVSCTDDFKAKVGEAYSWTSPIPGLEQTRAELP